jgi:hypothetical protein
MVGVADGRMAGMTALGFEPTDEQQAARDLFVSEEENIAIEALAGTGKTSTLRFIAATVPALRFQYVAFNKAIVTDAENSMPGNVSARTAHSLAFAAVGRQYAHRLQSKRLRSIEIADRLGITYGFDITYGSQTKTLPRGWLASHVMRAATAFCQTADPEPTARHFPYVEGIDVLASGGRRTYVNNNAVAEEMLPALRTAWADLSSPGGTLRFSHDVYLKVWQLGTPKIDADVILFDEAQDANPVLLDIVERQDHAQRVWVGDSRQAIYQWRGAVDALAKIDASARAHLTQSFRFGHPIAEHANLILARLGETLRVRGHDAVESRVGAHEAHTAILCRSNARAVRHVLDHQQDGGAPHLVGGGKEVLAFARGARQLREEGFSSHPDLACFKSWAEVEDYVANDPSGSDLALNFRLVEEFGTTTIITALGHPMPEPDADVIVSTAHKAKGREWPTVLLSDDFEARLAREEEPPPEELRLLYVASTRARHGLDDRWVRHIIQPPEPAGEDDEAEEAAS